jgi:hypothetical protein
MIKALEIIAPHSTVEPCVDDSKAPGQCRTAKQAAGPILRSFERYGITAPGEKAALLSLMVMETAEFKYRRNVYPGTPGQGSKFGIARQVLDPNANRCRWYSARNMQMPNWNQKYAASLPEISQQYEPVKDNVDAVLELLLKNDDHDFGSAAWFLVTNCPGEVRAELQKGTDEGWERYITQCVHTTVTDERRKYWLGAREVMAAR